MNTRSNLFQKLSEDMRVSPVNRHLLVGYEENLMNAETYVYSICQQIGIPCSKVLYYCLLDSYVGYGEYNDRELYENNMRKLRHFLKVNRNIDSIHRIG